MLDPRRATPLTMPYLKAQIPMDQTPAIVSFCVKGAEIELTRADKLVTAMRQAASLLNVLALGISCEADMLESERPGQTVLLGVEDDRANQSTNP